MKMDPQRSIIDQGTELSRGNGETNSYSVEKMLEEAKRNEAANLHDEAERLYKLAASIDERNAGLRPAQSNVFWTNN